jgi:hypothetical protein
MRQGSTEKGRADAGHEELRRIYRELQEGDSPAGVVQILRAAARTGVAGEIGELGLIADLLESAPYTVVPRWMIAFIVAYLREKDHATLYDSSAGVGSLLGGAAVNLRPARAVGVSKKPGERALARILHPSAPVDWVTEEPPAGERFAVVLGVVVPDPSAILRAAGRIQDGGTGIFIASGPGWTVGDEEPFVAALRAERVPVSAVLLVESGALILTGPGAVGPILVGRLVPEQGARDTLLKNISLRREGKAPDLGILVEPDRFQAVADLLLSREIEEQLHRIGGEVVPMGRILQDVRAASVEEESGPSPVLYLPLAPELPVAASFHTIRGEERSYLRALLDPGMATPGYLVRFFESPTGRQIRTFALRSALHGDPLSAWMDAPVPLFPVAVQDEVLRVQAALTHQRERIDGLERQLWDHPGAAEKIGRIAYDLARGDEIEAWMETLPFPLASILWGYVAEKNVEHRVDHLFHFFEAFSEFVALIMLSALSPLLIRQKIDLLEENSYFRDAYRHATFRSWNVLGRRLARHTRELMGDKTTYPACLTQYGDPDPDFLDMITSKRLFAVLDEVADFRNVWKAHGGVVGEEEEQHRRAQLEDCLARIRQITGTTFAPVTLLAPGSGRFHEGIYRYEAEALKGTHLTFPQIEVETVLPMDTDRLYLIHARRLRPLELLPLVLMMESPCTPLRACYFYNRMEGDQIRWVSYHFEHRAEIVRSDPGIRDIFSTLRLIGKKGEEPE